MLPADDLTAIFEEGNASFALQPAECGISRTGKPGMNLLQFRERIIGALRDALDRHADARLHLLYAPELADPLKLADETRRDQAILRPWAVAPEWPETAWPRLITLDCRRVAAYLLESNPGLDDPLLEASITQAHAEVHLGQRVRSVVTNDDPGMAESAVCGWVVSPQTARQLAGRINSNSSMLNAQHKLKWVRWYQPEYIDTLWPTLTPAQQHALLGDAVWLAHDVTGRPLRFAADEAAAGRPESDARRIGIAQSGLLDNMTIVTELLPRWQDLCTQAERQLPADARQQLHRHASAARQLGLDAENLSLYVMVAVQLVPSGTDAPEFRRMVQQAVARGTSLREGLRGLPEEFWECHGLEDPAPAHAPHATAGQRAPSAP